MTSYVRNNDAHEPRRHRSQDVYDSYFKDRNARLKHWLNKMSGRIDEPRRKPKKAPRDKIILSRKSLSRTENYKSMKAVYESIGKVNIKALQPKDTQPEVNGTQLMISNNNFAEPQERPLTPRRSVPMTTPTDFDRCIIDSERVLRCYENLNYSNNKEMEKPTKNATIVDLKLNNAQPASPRLTTSKYFQHRSDNQTPFSAGVSAKIRLPEAPEGCRAYIRKFQKLTPFPERIVPQTARPGRYGFESIEKTTHRNQQPPVIREPVYKTDSCFPLDIKMPRNTVLLKPMQTQNHVRNLKFGGPGCSADLSAPPQRYNASKSFFLTDMQDRDKKLLNTPAGDGPIQFGKDLPL